MRAAVILGAVLMLTACAGPALRDNPFGVNTERALYAAIKEVEATPDQRRKILLAYDANERDWRAQRDEARVLLDRWKTLDRRGPEFASQAAALAGPWGELHARQMNTQTAFDAELVAILDPEQWRQWREFNRFQSLPELNADEDAEDGPPRGPVRRRR